MRLLHAIAAATQGSASILDVGCGTGNLHCAFPHDTLVWAIDGYLPDLLKVPEPIGSPRTTRVHGLLPAALVRLRDRSFDTVIACDVVEHLLPLEAVFLIKEMERVAQKRVCLFIPEGNHPQTNEENPLQNHQSSWWAADLKKLGYDVDCWHDFHADAGGGKDPGALWCVKLIEPSRYTSCPCGHTMSDNDFILTRSRATGYPIIRCTKCGLERDAQ